MWWRTTIELNVTLGTLADRTWHIGNTPDLTDKPEHRETLLVEPQSGSTLALSSQCSDWPVSLTAEYSANETEFRLWYPGVRYEVYSKQP